MAYLICPRCFRGRPHDQQCSTPSCAELLGTVSYQRDQIEGQLVVAQDMLAHHPEDTSENWEQLLLELTAELEAFDQKMAEHLGLEGAAAKTAAKFRQ